MSNFWSNLPKSFFILAPMDDVTDVVFRQVVAEVGRPDVFFTEFVNVDGLNSKGREALMPRLEFTPDQQPIVAQIWGKTPENYFKVAQLIKELGFDGIDINMGCPEKNVLKNGCCAALINNHPLAKEIIEATIKGSGGLPVSVKTRTGVGSVVTEEWISFLLQFDLSAITLHARTARQMSKVPADWSQIKKAVELRNRLRNQLRNSTLIIGNGDVESLEDGLKKVEETDCDGIMIGRGIFKDIFIFKKDVIPSECIRAEGSQDKSRDSSLITQNDGQALFLRNDKQEMLDLLVHHARLFDKRWGGKKNFAILRKFFKIYTLGMDNASDLREKLMQTKSLEEVDSIIKEYGRN